MTAASVLYQEDFFGEALAIELKSATRPRFYKKPLDLHVLQNTLELFEFVGLAVNDEVIYKPLPVVTQDVLNQYLEPIVTHNKSDKMRVNGGNEAWKALKADADIEWTTADWSMAHIRYLHLSLEVFNPGHTAKERAEVVEWIFSGDYAEIDGKMVWSTTIAFSFNACCAVAGYDPGTLQHFIFEMLPEPVQLMLEDAGAA